MREYLKRSISSTLKIAGCFRVDDNCAKGVILLYHSIGPADKDDYLKLRVDKDNFNRQMEYLYENKYSVVPLTEMINKLNLGRETENKKFISITFDDGYADNLEFAAPVLKKYCFSATTFITTGYLDGQGRGDKYWDKWGYLTTENIRELLSSGFEVGSHSSSHRMLTSLDDTSLRREILDSKKVLKGAVKNKVTIFSYPHGAFNKRVENILKEEGYIAACTSITGFNNNKSNVFELKRIEIRGGNSLQDFINKIDGHYNWLGYFQKMRSLKDGCSSGTN